MQTSARPAWLALAWISACVLACVPPDPPEWVVAYPITWGIQASVVGAGVYSQDLEVLPGHTRAEMLPGDTVELRWFGAAPEDAQIRPPIWMLAYGPITPFMFEGGIPACQQPLTSLYGFCRLGEGERVRVTLASLEALLGTLNLTYFGVLAIASDGDVIEPETCLQRAFSERNPDLAGCLIATRSVSLGPGWRLSELFPPGDELPAAYYDVPADTNPIITALRVERSSAQGVSTQLATSGDRISVRPGEQIAVTLELDADAAQEFVYLSSEADGSLSASTGTETLTVEARLNAVTVDFERSDDQLTYRWTAPDAPEGLTFFVQVADDRGGFDFANLRFVSTLADGESP